MPCRTPLKYVGGKGKLLPEILKYLPEDTDVIVEPFCGSAALSFSLDKPFYISDMSPELIVFFEELRDNPDKLYSEALKLSQQHSKEFYLEVRQWDRSEGFLSPEPVSRTLRAARYLYIIYHGFNGIYRVNQKGYCNTPSGGDSRKYPEDIKQLLVDASKHLNTWCKGIFLQEFDNTDLLKSMIDSGENPFVLIDPPYFNQDGDKKVFQEYTTTKIDAGFILRLSDYMDDLNNAGISFLMTNTYCKTIEKCFPMWRLDKVPTKYIVGGKSEREGCKFEYFVSNKV